MNGHTNYSLECCTADQVHNAAEKVFGKSYYIDHSDML